MTLNATSRIAPSHRAVSKRFKNAGFAYVEVLIASALIAVVLPAAIQASFAASTSATQQRLASAQHEARVERMEQVRGSSYSALLALAEAAGDEATPTSLSDNSADPNAVFVYLARYDGDADPFVVADPNFDGDANAFTDYRGLLWVRISSQGESGELHTLVRPNHVVIASHAV